MPLIERLVYARRRPGTKRLVRALLALQGIEIPPEVEIGEGLRMVHRGFGAKIHPGTVLGDRVAIFQNVTVGRGKPWELDDWSRPCAYIGDDVILCPGAVIMEINGPVTVGRGTVIGANAVLGTSTGEWEVWSGSPARRVGDRVLTPLDVAHPDFLATVAELGTPDRRKRPAPE
jgi:serine O-acetyltransferase